MGKVLHPIFSCKIVVPIRWQWLLTAPRLSCKALLANRQVGTCLSLLSWKMLVFPFKTLVHVLWGFGRLKLQALWIVLCPVNGYPHGCGGIQFLPTVQWHSLPSLGIYSTYLPTLFFEWPPSMWEVSPSIGDLFCLELKTWEEKFLFKEDFLGNSKRLEHFTFQISPNVILSQWHLDSRRWSGKERKGEDKIRINLTNLRGDNTFFFFFFLSLPEIANCQQFYLWKCRRSYGLRCRKIHSSFYRNRRQKTRKHFHPI